MIEYRKTSIFKCGAEALVNPVNCVGVSGAGLARQFKNKFPENHRRYKDACDRGDLRPGAIHVFETGLRTRDPDVIINFPTKDHFRDPSQMVFLERGLATLREYLSNSDHRSVAVPKLGCGLGGLDWSTVEPLVRSALDGLGTRVIILSLISS